MNDEGQLYTIEGIAAAALILTTVYLVLNSTMVFTPGETHIYDMQLEQLGNDVLAVMDQPVNGSSQKSPLEEYIEKSDQASRDLFSERFLKYSTTTTGVDDNIQFEATIYHNTGGQVIGTEFVKSRDYHREKAVMVTRWVNIDGSINSSLEWRDQNQTVLLEVLLWRG